MKTCSKCQCSKSESEFYFNRAVQRLDNLCKKCRCRYQAACSKRKWDSDPLYRERKYLKSLLTKIRRGRVKNPTKVTLDEIAQRMAAVERGIVLPKFPRQKKPKPVKIPKPPRPPKISPETKRRNWLIFEANQLRGEQKKQARAEKAEFMRAWTKKWGFLAKKRNGKATRKRRDDQIRHSRAVHDPALTAQIALIHRGPCICFWCDSNLPHGGTVDHIKALASGGSHTSDNICAACSRCNSKKRENTPAEAGFTAVLL